MDTQNTPIHLRIWSRHFWMLVLANLLLGVSVFMLLPYIPAQMQADGYTLRDVGLVMLAFGLGIVIPGPYVSYFIERFRRNKVCLLSILLLVVFSAILYEADVQKVFHIGFSGTLAVRVLQGFCYGLTEMVVYSTLVLDTCESLYRTEASHVLSWTGRCSLALGPLAAMIINQVFGVSILPLASAGCALLSVILMYVIPFPFRAPNEVVRPWSLDRFFLPKSTPLVVNTILITATFGLLLSLPLSLTFYALMLPGFLLALLAEKYVFANAELESEAITGLIVLFVGFLMLLTRNFDWVSPYVAVMAGFAFGLLGSRFLLFFIKLSQHCQRGTVQSSFFLSWELGLWLGLYAGFGLLHRDLHSVVVCSIVLIGVALLVYHFLIHGWYVTHKNR